MAFWKIALAAINSFSIADLAELRLSGSFSTSLKEKEIVDALKICAHWFSFSFF